MRWRGPFDRVDRQCRRLPRDAGCGQATPERTTNRRLLLGTIAAALGVLVPVLLLEGLLRFLPVTEPAYAQPVNAQMPYRHYLPNREVTYSRGWSFSIVARKHVNNYGFTSDTDFVRDDERPLLTIIGDSFVEAWQVGNAQTMHGLLNARVAGRGRVYGIGFSGSALSQYLAYAGMAREEFGPRSLVIIVVGNDFDESLIKYKREPGFYYFAERDGNLVPERLDHPGQSQAVALTSKSSLAMYVRHTIGFDWWPVSASWKDSSGAVPRFVGNVIAEAAAERVADSKAAVDAFLGQLPARSGLRPENILFIVDAIRPQLYTPSELVRAEGTYFGQMRRYFMQQAAAGGFEVVDITPAFAKAFARDGRRFEFPTDNHWNELGHSVVAEQIARSRVFARTFQ
jgi:hypothetical protein